MAAVYREKRTIEVRNEHYDFEQHKTVLDSIGKFLIEVEVDIDSLFNTLGRRAARSKGGKAVMGGGTIRVRRVRA